MSYKLMVFRSSVTGGKRGWIVRECKVKRYLNKCAMSMQFLFFNFIQIYLFHFPGVAAEP